MEDVKESKDYHFPTEEEAILKLWDDLDAFQEQLRRSKGRPEYIFYDGPPFATGLPHYGHLLAGTIKDIVTRYACGTGYHVSRRFGWDCHGLPVEYEIDKKLNIKSRHDVLTMGIDTYNEECRSIVMRYSKEWETIVKRIGRWIDFEVCLIKDINIKNAIRSLLFFLCRMIIKPLILVLWRVCGGYLNSCTKRGWCIVGSR